MPFTRRRRTLRKRHTTRPKRTRRARRKTSSGYGRKDILRLNGIPKRGYGVLNYVDVNHVTTAGITPYADTWRLNGLFDPYVAAGGHQPYLFDQMTAFFTKNQVNSNTIVVEGFLNGAGTTGALIMMICSEYSTLPVTDPFILMETSNSKFMRYKMVADVNMKFKMSMSCKNHVLLGITKAEYDEDIYTGTNVADPVKGTWVHILAFAPDKTSAISLDYTIKIKYKAEFSNPVMLAQS